MDTQLETEEIALIRQTVNGDQDAFCSLVLFYEGPLVAYLTAFLGDGENARDIAQETFISAYYALPDWKMPDAHVDSSQPSTSRHNHEHPLGPWLYRIATNKALTFLKKNKKSATLFEPQERYVNYQKTTLSGRLEDNENVEDRYILRELLQNALAQLKEEDAICIVFRFVLDEKYSEIAERLHLSKEAVRKRIYRGLTSLQSIFTSIKNGEDFQ